MIIIIMAEKIDLLLAFTAEGCVPEQQHHRVDVVRHPCSLDLEVPLKQAASQIFQHSLQSQIIWVSQSLYIS